jgi:hypothetical protein
VVRGHGHAARRLRGRGRGRGRGRVVVREVAAEGVGEVRRPEAVARVRGLVARRVVALEVRAGRGLRLELVVVEVVGGALGHGVQVRHLLLLHVGRLARDDLVRDLVAAERAPALARAVALRRLLEVAVHGAEQVPR